MESQINSKNSIQEEIRLRIQAGNRSLFANKKLLNNKDLNAASKLQRYKSIIRPTVTYGCETWAMTGTEKIAYWFSREEYFEKYTDQH